MATIIFQPSGVTIEVDNGTKILVAAVQNSVVMSYGCASARCGTCVVKVSDPNNMSPMEENEKELLEKMEFPLDQSVRLACQAKILKGEVSVDTDFHLE